MCPLLITLLTAVASKILTRKSKLSVLPSLSPVAYSDDPNSRIKIIKLMSVLLYILHVYFLKKYPLWNFSRSNYIFINYFI